MIFMELEMDDKMKCCEVGDKFYRVSAKYNMIIEFTIVDIQKMDLGHYIYKSTEGNDYTTSTLLGKDVYTTREEASKALQYKRAVKEKRARMKQYELKLNKELGLENHFIIN